MFGFVKSAFSRIYQEFTTAAGRILAQQTIDAADIETLRRLLITADVGTATTQTIIERLKTAAQHGQLSGSTARDRIKTILAELMDQATPTQLEPRVLLLVGVNGSGKTTFIGKFAALLKSHGKRVLVIAGDTWRAAASDQLAAWASMTGVDFHAGKVGQDASAVVFDGCQRFLNEGYDHLIIDTAGRLQTSVNLMRELEKIHRVILKKIPKSEVSTWLVLDALIGQNALAQAKEFHAATPLDGVVVTKLDSSSKGGMIFAIVEALKKPVVYISYGESTTAIKPFDTMSYINDLFEA